MKKIIYILIVSVILSGCNTNITKQKTYSGILEVTIGTKGGDGYDSCLGSPFYKLKLSDSKEIKLNPYPYLKNNTMSVSDFEKLLGRHLKITGDHIKQKDVNVDEGKGKGQQEMFSEKIKSISCDHIEITEFEILE